MTLSNLSWADFASEYPELAQHCAEESPSAVGKDLSVRFPADCLPERYKQFITLSPGSNDGFPIMVV